MDLSNVTCKTIMVYEGIENQITVSGEHVSLLKTIMERYEKLLASWEVE